jgi:HK97 family phage prohead protease
MLRGYAAVFEKLSLNLGGFREQIMPGAFDGVLKDDVRALFNHDENCVLGRSIANTLRFGVDKEGLWYEIDLPDTQSARDLLTSVKRGDVSQSSFAFTVAPGGAEWSEDDQTGTIRSVTKIARLYDVSPVTYPAYPEAPVAARSLSEWRKERETKNNTEKDVEKEKIARDTQSRARHLQLLEAEVASL